MKEEIIAAEEAASLPKSMSEVAPPSAAASSATGAVVAAVSSRMGHLRWSICALLFFATTINYVDRQVIGILSKDLQAAFHWTEIDYGNIVAAFNAAYALGLLLAGRLIDRFGTKIGYAVALTIWSLAAMSHALARSAFGFGVARATLGVGEAGNFPAAIKTTAEWFPKKERALATGIFNAGSNVGAIVAPLVVPWLALRWGWQAAFIWTGLLSATWLAFWLSIYRAPQQHPKCSPAELALIRGE